MKGNPYAKGAAGITVRGFPPCQQGLQAFPLGKRMLEEYPSQIASGPGLAILRIFQGVSDLLCGTKPKDRVRFQEVFSRQGTRLFQSPWGTSAFRLENADLQ